MGSLSFLSSLTVRDSPRAKKGPGCPGVDGYGLQCRQGRLVPRFSRLPKQPDHLPQKHGLLGRGELLARKAARRQRRRERGGRGPAGGALPAERAGPLLRPGTVSRRCDTKNKNRAPPPAAGILRAAAAAPPPALGKTRSGAAKIEFGARHGARGTPWRIVGRAPLRATCSCRAGLRGCSRVPTVPREPGQPLCFLTRFQAHHPAGREGKGQPG